MPPRFRPSPPIPTDFAAMIWNEEWLRGYRFGQQAQFTPHVSVSIPALRCQDAFSVGIGSELARLSQIRRGKIVFLREDAFETPQVGHTSVS